MRERIGAWWGRNWDTVLFFVIGALVVGAPIALILHSSYMTYSQPVYSQNTNEIMEVCRSENSYPGYLLECLERRGYTLLYNGEPVERLDMTYGEWKAGNNDANR